MALFVLTLDYTQPPNVTHRKWSDFCKAANQAVAEEWERRFSPLHFQPYSSGKYGYEKRAAATLARKKRMARKGKVLGGGLIPLVNSGLLQQQMARTGILTVYPTRFVLAHPTHVPRMARNSLIDLHAEAVKIIPSEDRYLTDVWRERLLKELASYKPRSTKTT
jgi:hypothetical protein